MKNKENMKNKIDDSVDNFKNPTFFKALKNALRGIKLVILSERNIKIQLVITAMIIIMGFLFKINLAEWLILTITIFLVLITECLNTAVEKTVDMITTKYSKSAKNVKDISAGAVLFSAIASIVVGIIIFLPKILIYIY